MILAAVLLFFSFKPDPNFSVESWLPEWLIRFGDGYPDFRTFVPYFLIATLVPFLPLGWRTELSGRFLGRVGAVLAGFLFVSEVIQWGMPARRFSWMDLFWGGAGVLAGLGVGVFLWLAVTGLFSDRRVSKAEGQRERKKA